MNNISYLIKRTEEKWLALLYNQVKKIFKNNPLPSHNENHHKRVWNYAVNILEELDKKGIHIESSDLENLIISAFFHDTGLVLDKGPNHGTSSSWLCKKWLEDNNLSDKVNAEKILQTIEYHDNKNYIGQSPLFPDGKVNVLGVLNISDDLDAFGYIGIYRYSEIYIIRGIPLEELGKQVLSNVSKRFNNFLDQCSSVPILIEIHTPRYKVIEDFFKIYNSRISYDPFSEYTAAGPVFIINFFFRQIHDHNNSIVDMCNLGIKKSINKADMDFFQNLKKDWRNLK